MPEKSPSHGDAQNRGQEKSTPNAHLGAANGSAGPIQFAMAPTPPVETISWLSAANPAPAVDSRIRAQEAVARGNTLFRQGRFAEALQSYREAVQLQPNEADYHFRLGIAAWQSGVHDLAATHLQEAIRFVPNNSVAHEALGLIHCEAGNMELALAHSARALELHPHDLETIASRAGVLETSGQHQEAWRLLEPLLASGRISAQIGTTYGRIAPKLKRERDAVAVIQRLLGSPSINAQQKISLHYTAASLLDRLSDWDAAFKQARLANELGRRPYDPAQHSQWIQRQIDYFTPAKLHDLPRASHRNHRPVFIIGMMRSGTSLVEQILASHPQVHGAGELNTLRRMALSAEGTPWAEGATYPEYLETLSVRNANELAQTYLSAISSLNETATYVTDKMPHNFLYLGLILTLFPDCHVIHCTRNPLDTCLSCYMTQFLPSRHPFTRDLGYLGAFYRDYHRLMKHWKTVLNFPMIEVNYETLVGDLEGQTRRLLELLDLPWDDRCLQFHQNKRYVATASYDQVRRPIYTSSVGRWKNYERHLSELMPFLAQAGLLRRSA